MIFREREGEIVSKAVVSELCAKIRDLECRVKSLEYELKGQKMATDVLSLTIKDRLKHEIVSAMSHFGEYERHTTDLFDRGYSIRRTFSNGEWELWVKREDKHD